MEIISLIGGMLLGMSLAAPPGPMNAIIAEESVIYGWNSGFRAGLGAMCADLCFFILALFGVVNFVEQIEFIREAILIMGGLLMIYFATGAFKKSKQIFYSGNKSIENSRGFEKAFILALSNPYQIVWWLTAGIALLEPGTLNILGVGFNTGGFSIIFGFFGGILIWITGFPFILNYGKARINKFAPAIGVLSAIVLVSFGFIFLYNSLFSLLGFV